MSELLGQILISQRAVSAVEVERALSAQAQNGQLLGQVLVDQGACSQEEVLKALGEQLDLPFTRLRESDLDLSARQLVPADLAYRHQALPLRLENGSLVVAVSDPFNFAALDDLQLISGLPVSPVLATQEDIRRFLEGHYVAQMFEQTAGEDVEILQDSDNEIGDLQRLAKEAAVIRFVNMLLRQAVQDRASDVHIEPFEKGVRVRYRIDGVLHEMPAPPKRLQAAVISRVKIMAELDIAERRLPQDGRIKLRVSGKEVDLRVSTVPTLFGESVVMRILEKTNVLYGLEELGMLPQMQEAVADLIAIPHGIILVTGPTGSGKTTTLYAALRRAYSTERKIITIEDPVEYQLDGINQIHVRPKIGLTFANGLRHILRQDPDIIMVGEIRDPETAEIAIHAALTGHLVFSTIHTNDAAGALTRLLEMGIEPYLIASSVEGVLAQRLVRLLCSPCRKRDLDLRKPADRDNLFLKPPRGCDECKFTGYRGRTGIFELLVVDDDVKQLVLDRAPAGRMKEVAVNAGMTTLMEDGLEKVRRHLTTMAEVARVTHEDERSGDVEELLREESVTA